MPTIDRREVLDRESYEQVRPEVRRRVMMAKDRRRVLVGEHCSVLFESRETMLYQVHEMLRAESSWDRTGAVDDELEAYNPLVPGAGELSATVMFEYETAAERAVFLPRLVGIERHLALTIGDTAPVLARFDRGQIDEHKVSSVQYVRFPLTDEQRRLLKEDGTVVRLVLDHPALQGQAVVGEATRREIMNDPD